MSQEGWKGDTFTNNTGKIIRQLYIPTDFMVPGKIYGASMLHRKRNHSLAHYVKELLSFIFNSQMKQLFSSISMKPKKTLQSVYSMQSMAILVNSGDLDDALNQALEYNIPLLQVVILSEEGEIAIRDKILMTFTVAHFINQNFVLYGDWEDRLYLHSVIPEPYSTDVKSSMSQYEGVYVRKGEHIYAFIPMKMIQSADPSVLQENLIKVRNMFYIKEQRSHITFSNISRPPPGESEISASSSMFGANRNSYNEGDNFNDSDEEQEEQQWEVPPGEEYRV